LTQRFCQQCSRFFWNYIIALPTNFSPFHTTFCRCWQ
jgi:hypothetical protein